MKTNDAAMEYGRFLRIEPCCWTPFSFNVRNIEVYEDSLQIGDYLFVEKSKFDGKGNFGIYYRTLRVAKDSRTNGMTLDIVNKELAYQSNPGRLNLNSLSVEDSRKIVVQLMKLADTSVLNRYTKIDHSPEEEVSRWFPNGEEYIIASCGDVANNMHFPLYIRTDVRMSMELRMVYGEGMIVVSDHVDSAETDGEYVRLIYNVTEDKATEYLAKDQKVIVFNPNLYADKINSLHCIKQRDKVLTIKQLLSRWI